MSQMGVALQEPAQLFHYLPKYRVVICTSCRHAVPPRAVNRHLKEIHGMHHSLRPKFVQFAERLDLCEPEELVLPEGDFPIPQLREFDGLRCSFLGCGHLCLTEKRMKSHWATAQHPCSSATKEKSWNSVPVQTFFRGNQLKYFSGPTQAQAQAQSDEIELRFTSLEGVDGAGDGDAGHREQPPDILARGRQIYVDNTAEGLLRHFETSTYATITTTIGINDQTLWQETVPQLARQHEFLWLALLAFTSLHLAHLYPDRRGQLAMQATSYQDRAIPLFLDVMAAPTADNCNAIIAFHHLLILYTFAAEQPDDDLLLITKRECVDSEVVPRWLHFIHSACVLLCDVWDYVVLGPCRILAFAWDAPFTIDKAYEESTLRVLLTLVPSTEGAWTVETVELYQEAASELARAFAYSESSPDQFSIWDILRVWPVRLSPDFITLLQQEHPCALILLAHYTVLLQRIDDLWYFRGRADCFLGTIHRKLDPSWHACIPPALTLPGVERYRAADCGLPATEGSI